MAALKEYKSFSDFKPPFRVGKKNKKAVLDADGIEVMVLHKNKELVQELCDWLNSRNKNK